MRLVTTVLYSAYNTKIVNGFPSTISEYYELTVLFFAEDTWEPALIVQNKIKSDFIAVSAVYKG